MPTDEWTAPPKVFKYIHFELINPEQNQRRYYLISWQNTLLGPGVVRSYGRKGETQTLTVEPFASLAEAWPTIRATIRSRLRHGYVIVGIGIER